jgi:hypothetical protein
MIDVFEKDAHILCAFQVRGNELPRAGHMGALWRSGGARYWVLAISM